VFTVTIKDDQGELLIGVVENEEDAGKLISEREWRLFSEEQARSCRNSSGPAMTHTEAKKIFTERMLAAIRRVKISRI
jgi:hypothetical protein